MYKSSLNFVFPWCIMASVYLATGSAAQIKDRQPDPAATHAGQEVFQKTCMQCHAVIAGQYSFGPNLAGETKKPGHKVTGAEMRAIIENGKGKMPPMKDKVTSSEIDDLVAYMRTL